MWEDLLLGKTRLLEIPRRAILRRIGQAARLRGRQMIGTLAFV
jgi:hypothetical protein